MVSEIKKLLCDAAGEISFGLRSLCGKPSPIKRFIIVSAFGALLGIVFLCTLVNSICNIGKNDGQQTVVEHIKPLELKHSKDSINQKKQKLYEYEQKQSAK
jgi:hypothetical protein